jgi:GABA permease
MKRRILVVANETLEGRALRDVTRLSTDGGPPAEMLVVAPALNSRLRHWLSDEDEARRCAGLRLGASLERLRAAGIGAEGRVGDPTPLQAIADALHEFRAQEIVIVQREGRSHWLTRDLVGRARRRFAQPVAQVGVEQSKRSEPVTKSTTRRRCIGTAKGSAVHRPREASA